MIQCPTNHRALIGSALLLVGSLRAPSIWAQETYQDAPAILSDAAKVVAKRIVLESKKPQVEHPEAELSGEYELMVFYTVADAVTPKQVAPGAPTSIRQLSARRYTSELQRTDKQIGASPSASGSTSLLEKAGLVDLLGFAIEHGAVLRENSGTSATLTATPYSLMTLNIEDTAAAYNRFDLLRRLEVSGSFKLNSGDGQGSQTIDFNDFEQWSVRARLWGDRSTRSKEFGKQWDQTVGSKIQVVLANENSAVGAVIDDIASVRRMAKPLDKDLRDAIAAYLATSKSETDDTRIDHIKSLILSKLYQQIYVPITQDPTLVTASERQRIVAKLVPTLDSRKNFEQIDQAATDLLNQTANSPLVTLAYTNHRVNEGSGYSDLKLLADTPIPFPDLPSPDLLLNAGVSFNHDPKKDMNQGTIRSYSIAGSLEWTAENLLRHLLKALDNSYMTLALGGRYERMEDQSANIWLAQGRIEFPLVGGVSLPVSVTYASRSELVNESEVRGNFGISLDTDKLLALAGLSQTPH